MKKIYPLILLFVLLSLAVKAQSVSGTISNTDAIGKLTMQKNNGGCQYYGADDYFESYNIMVNVTGSYTLKRDAATNNLIFFTLYSGEADQLNSCATFMTANAVLVPDNSTWTPNDFLTANLVAGNRYVLLVSNYANSVNVPAIPFDYTISVTDKPAGSVVAFSASAPAALTYPTPNQYTKGTSIGSLNPSLIIGTANSYTISPALPSGLNINPYTGRITGTPASGSAATDYTVTATNQKGSTSAVVRFSVNSLPTDITLSNGSVQDIAGSNAVVGTLVTTDDAWDSPTYALVTGTGATNNSSFNISGNQLRVNNPSAMNGNYSVRIRTTDSFGATFEKAFTINVFHVNVAPVLTSSGGITAFTEGNNVISTPVVIDPGMTVSDSDNSTLSSLTVQITGNYQGAQDRLGFVENPATMGNITGSYVPATGAYNLTSSGATATLAQWQAAIRAITFTSLSETPSTLLRTVIFTISDGSLQAIATKQVSVTSVNDTPILTTSSGTSSFVQGAGTVIIDGSVQTSDLDNATFVSAEVAISSAFQAGDQLSFTNNLINMGNITASYNSGTGILTLSSSGATATIAQWNAALSSVTFSNSLAAPSTADRIISYKISDGSSFSAPSAKTVSVTAIATVQSLVRLNASPTNQATVNYKITFSQAVTGLDVGDFTLSTSGLTGASLSSISGSGTTYTISTTGYSGSGTLQLNFTRINGVSPLAAAAFNGEIYSIDRVAPVIPAAPDLTGGTDTGDSNTDNLTRNNTPTFTGTTEANAIVELFSGGILKGSAIANSLGNYSITTTALNEGTQNITVQATDAVGNVSLMSPALSITIDVTAPSTPVILNPVNNAYISNQKPLISGTGEALSHISLNVDGVTYSTNVTGGGTWSFTPTTNIAEGNRNISAASRDAAGNVSAMSLNSLVHIDVTAPAINTVNVPANGTYSAGQVLSATINFSENIVVTGTPQLDLTLDNGGTVQASYVSGSGSSSLVFNYTILAGQSDFTGIAYGNALALNGGSISDLAQNNAVLTLNALPSSSAVLVDARITQTLNLNTAVNKSYGDGDFNVGAASSNSNDVTYPITYVSSDPLVATVNATGDVHIFKAGTTTITVNQAGDATYIAASPKTQTITVNPASLTVTATGPLKAYGQTITTGSSTINFVYSTTVGSELVTAVTLTPDAAGASPATPAGTGYVVTPSAAVGSNGFLASNYMINYQVYTGTVGKTGQTISFGSLHAATYGDVPVTLTATTSSGLAVTYNSSNPAVATVTGNTMTIVGAGTTTITASQAGNSNFTPATNVTQLFTVNQRALIITATASNKVYDGNQTAAVSLSDNRVSGDVFTVTYDPAFFNDQHTGNAKTVTVNNLNIPAAAAINYTYNTTAITAADITPKPITITATAGQSKIYGTPDPVFAYTSNVPLIVGDVFTGSLNRNAGENVGNYAIGRGSLALSNDYNLTYSGSNFSILVKPVTVIADVKTKVYASPDPILTFTTDVPLIGTDVFTGSLNRNAGENVGSYTINKNTLALNSNYLLSYTAASLSITKKTLTITADDKFKFQGTANPVLTASYSGFVPGENPSNLQAQASLTTSATASSLPGSYPIVVAGATSNNYAITFNNGTLTVSPGIPTALGMANTELFENRPAGTLAGIFSSTSNDPGATFTYTLVAGAGSTDNASFSISGNQLLTAQSFDYETKNTYIIRVRTTTQYGLFLDQTFTINVLDVNEAPTLNALADQAICTTPVIQNINLTGISAGPETSQTTTLSVSSNNAGLFDDLSVSQAGVLSYKIKSGASGVVNITATVKDNGGTANNGNDTFSRSFNLTIYALPTPVIASDKGNEVSKGETITLTASGGTSYSWSNANGIISGQNTAVLTVRPSVTTTYTVTATNANGCSQSTSFTISILSDFSKLKITNLLTPNGDGFNDRWTIENIDLYPANEVKVFDKAGKLVYTKKGYDNSWDGSFNGAPLAENTYYYIVDFGPNFGKLRGFITIVRGG